MRAAVLLVVLAAGCGKGASTTAESPRRGEPAPRPLEPVARLAAIQLFEEYGENPAAADAKYRGRAVEVSGAGQLTRGEGGGYDFGFAVVEPVGMFPEQLKQLPEREQRWFHNGYPPNVVAHLSPAATDEAARLKPAGSVRVVGVVRGSARADVWRDYVVDLDDCTIVPAGK